MEQEVSSAMGRRNSWLENRCDGKVKNPKKKQILYRTPRGRAMEGTGGKDVLRDCKKNKLIFDERVSYLKRT